MLARLGDQRGHHRLPGRAGIIADRKLGRRVRHLCLLCATRGRRCPFDEVDL
jgi:hypothetical protein